MSAIVYLPIGYIYTPFEEISGMPIQPACAKGIKGKIEIVPEFTNGLQDLDGFSYLILLYHFHLSENFELLVTPFLDTQVHGVFATRAPKRPNSIGMSVVKLTKIIENILYIEDIDVINKTPLIDIKPYIPDFETPEQIKTGWYRKEKTDISKVRSDKRFKD